MDDAFPCQEARRRERLIAARGERSIAQVARETGVTRESLAAYEDGARRSMRYFVGNYRKIDWLRNVIDEMLKLMD